MKTIYNDEYTRIEEGEEFDLLTRKFADTDGIKTKLILGEGRRMSKAIAAADNDENAMPGHYISRFPEEHGYKIYKNPAAVALGKMGGSVKSDKKSKSSAANGALGGRPRKVKNPPTE